MGLVSKAAVTKAQIGDGPTDYEADYKVGNVNLGDKTKSDVWSLGATILHAGNIKTIKSIYNEQTFEINSEQLNKQLDEFEMRYKESSPPLVQAVKKMLSLEESKRPNFAELKREFCPEIGLRMKDQSYQQMNQGIDPKNDPFAGIGGQNRRLMNNQEVSLTQKQQFAYNFERLAVHPIYGGEFGKHLEVTGRSRIGLAGVSSGRLTLKQAQMIESMDQIEPKQQFYFQQGNYDWNQQNELLVQDSMNNQQPGQQWSSKQYDIQNTTDRSYVRY